jgi:hypothetical protein
MKKKMILKNYSELIQFDNFIDRFNYLKLSGVVGASTFGYDRYLNQALYASKEWRRFRNRIIVRDNGCDLGLEGYEISSRLLVHHINPITSEQLESDDSLIFDPNNVICVSHNTHEAIHYSDDNLLEKDPIIRKQNDTCPWR